MGFVPALLDLGESPDNHFCHHRFAGAYAANQPHRRGSFRHRVTEYREAV
jgi:hypothetical protein